MAENVDIEKEKVKINKEIKTLEGNKAKYKNMNKKLEESIEKLKKARDSLKTSYNQLNKNYSSNSKAAIKKRNMLQEQINEINKIIKKLKETILPESRRKISSISSKVTNKNDEIQKLKKE